MAALVLALILSGSAYTKSANDLHAHRVELSAVYQRTPISARKLLRNRARAVLLHSIRDHMLQAWIGTDWDFNGTTTTPNSGQIACGYLVSTVLQHAGFRLQRFRVAQQAAENIVKTLAGSDGDSLSPGRIWRFRNAEIKEVLGPIRRGGDGVYVIGLDYHVGFLVKRGELIEFCHSSYLGEAKVVCSDPMADPAMASNYHVIGELLSDAMIEGWILAKKIKTIGNHRPGK